MTAIDLCAGEFWGSNPHAELTWLRDNDPVHWDGNIWGITRHADVREISRRTDVFSSAQGMRPDVGPVDHMIDMDDPQHKQRRRLVYEGFTPRRVAAQEGRIQLMADGIIDRVCERGECDFVRDLAAWLPIEVIGQSLGSAPALVDTEEPAYRPANAASGYESMPVRFTPTRPLGRE